MTKAVRILLKLDLSREQNAPYAAGSLLERPAAKTPMIELFNAEHLEGSDGEGRLWASNLETLANYNQIGSISCVSCDSETKTDVVKRCWLTEGQ